MFPFNNLSFCIDKEQRVIKIQFAINGNFNLHIKVLCLWHMIVSFPLQHLEALILPCVGRLVIVCWSSRVGDTTVKIASCWGSWSSSWRLDRRKMRVGGGVGTQTQTMAVGLGKTAHLQQRQLHTDCDWLFIWLIFPQRKSLSFRFDHRLSQNGAVEDNNKLILCCSAAAD